MKWIDELLENPKFQIGLCVVVLVEIIGMLIHIAIMKGA